MVTLVGLVLCCNVADATWTGGISASAVDTRVDTVRSMVVDQQYDLHTTGRLMPRLQYTGSMRVRLLQTTGRHIATQRQTELQPTVSLIWANPYYSVRSNYLYRQLRGEANSPNFTGQSAAVSFQTNLSNLPRVQGRYEWTRNVNDLDLLGQDTRLRLYSLGSNYSIRSHSASYQYSNTRTLNPGTGLERTAERHVGRMDNVFQLAHKVAALQTGYQIVDRTEREIHTATGETLLPVPASAGLYLSDPSPELGTLELMPALIDGNTDIPVSPNLDLSGTEYHNFGLDFAATATVDYLYLSTDTLANENLRWAVYTSADNLTWTLVRNYQPAAFNTALSRYEVSLPRQLVRYIKLVMEPLPSPNPVQPTELRAFLARAGISEPRHSTDHRGTAEFRLQLAKWVHASVGADVLRTMGGQTTLAREQDGLRGTLRLVPATWAQLSGNVEFTRTRFPESALERTDGQGVVLSWESQWLPTLSTKVTGTQRREWTDKLLSRDSDALNVRAQTQWLPGLAGISEFGYIEDRRPETGDLFSTRIYGQSVDAQLTRPASLHADYRRYELDARYTPVPPYRETMTLRASYRLSSTLFVSGDLDIFREPKRHTRTEGAQASWNPTDKWFFGSGLAHTSADREIGSTLLNLYCTFRWTPRTEISFSYYRARYDAINQPGTSSARLTLNTRF